MIRDFSYPDSQKREKSLSREARRWRDGTVACEHSVSEIRQATESLGNLRESLALATLEEQHTLLTNFIDVVEISSDSTEHGTGSYAMNLLPGMIISVTITASNKDLLTKEPLVSDVDEKAPRGDHVANQLMIDQGAWEVKHLRREPRVLLYPWIKPSDIPSDTVGQQCVNRDPLALARSYQALLDAGIAESRAALARYLGVSRARVTQVLRRLDDYSQDARCDKPSGNQACERGVFQ